MADLSTLLPTLAAAWLTTYLLHSTLLLGAVWAASRLLGARAAALRTHLWRAALVGALVTASAQTSGFVTRLPQADIDPQALRAALAWSSPAAAPTAIDAAVSTPAGVAPRAPAAAPSASARDPVAPRATSNASARATTWLGSLAARWTELVLMQLVVLLWAAGAALGLLRLGVLAVLARRELADRIDAPGSLRDELSLLAAAQGMAAPRLTVSAALGGPVSLPNGEIVLPEWCLTLAPRQRAALLAHELAHQRHADPQWLSAALVLHSLLWVQPLLGVARRELAALAELEADAWAARAVDDPRALAECLARCAEHLVADRAALFGAAMADGDAGHSPLMQRIDRLLEGVHMKVKETPVTARVGVVLALVAGVFLLPGLVGGERVAFGGSSTNIHIDDDDNMSVSITRVGYQAKFAVDAKFALNDAETDVATLAAGGEFRLMEKSGGTKHEYLVEADKAGTLARSYKRDGKALPLDAVGKQWLAGALPKLLRESGVDVDGRVGRFLARGGPDAVFAEIGLIASDYARASYLGALLAQAKLDGPQLDRAVTHAGKIGSDFEKRRALSAALASQRVDAPRSVALLQVASTIGSDFERAELLVAAAEQLDAGDAVRAAWIAAAEGIGSDFELRRTLEEALDEGGKDPALVAAVLELAARRISSDFELRSLLQAATSGIGKDRVQAAAYIAASKAISSDFERREALCALLDDATLDAASLGELLDSAASIDSDFERLQVMQMAAPLVAGDAALTTRYRALSRDLDDHERGEALKALDDATRL